ncbi:uncharacterized protein ColSpa_01266 [Colletotrichum spaethianum]|uniref:Mitochondrial seryl-tRNA synthetase n=1 Tax=Colletotrichum spaethianum TaxID=700344 RepID=A0AA37L6J4_9PEZI|nr:uncharacterized protein ColSpa_01266 [Colletotrichum spaethianum]GKT41085.1 uncharacterized protein ColSpa_01266 [Colletotrichum spaethianum]
MAARSVISGQSLRRAPSFLPPHRELFSSSRAKASVIPNTITLHPRCPIPPVISRNLKAVRVNWNKASVMFASRAFARVRPNLRPRKPTTTRTTLRNTSTNSPPSSSSTARAAQRLLDRVPLRFQRYTTGLRKAPLSHIIAFLVLHEITAVVPLLGLFGLFHYTNFLPLEYVTGHWAGYVRDGVGMAERYFSRKGWFGFEARDRGTMTGELDKSEDFETSDSTADAGQSTHDLLESWQKDGKYKVVVEVAMAWAITKALLPARILVSVWGTPWFAGVMGRARGIFRSSR